MIHEWEPAADRWHCGTDEPWWSEDEPPRFCPFCGAQDPIGREGPAGEPCGMMQGPQVAKPLTRYIAMVYLNALADAPQDVLHRVAEAVSEVPGVRHVHLRYDQEDA